MRKSSSGVEMPKKAKYSHSEVIRKLGGICQVCRSRDLEILQIDHIDNDGWIERKEKGQQMALYKRIMENKQTRRVRVLCANCNYRRKVRLLKDGRPGRVVTAESMSEFLSVVKLHLQRLLN
jgi:hypothetical protein